MSEQTIVCVLGMHRSGTSLVARLLNVLGVELGPTEHLMRPSSANPAGHWESRLIKEINDEILQLHGGSWHEPPELPPGWERAAELAELRRAARELVEADFSGFDLWGFKDPRNSLTLPFWQRVLGPMRYVVCLRNPLDVAQSLRAREEESIPIDQGLRLWLRYVTSALAATASHPRHFVFYEDLMADPAPAVAELGRHVGRGEDAEVRAAIRVALSENLWHHRTPVYNVVDEAGLAFHVKALYLALRLFVSGSERVGDEVIDVLSTHATGAEREREAAERLLAESRASVSRLEAERDEERRRGETLRAELESARQERGDRERRLRELEAELNAARAELAEARLEVRRLREAAERASGPRGRTRGESRPGYAKLVGEVRERIREAIPSGATVLVAAKGDEAMLELAEARGWHFPQAADGRYAGYHLASDTAMIAHLEALRARGADHLVIPATTLWWLDHYRDFGHHLGERYECILRDERCAVYRLASRSSGRPAGPIAAIRQAAESLRIGAGREPSILDWDTGIGLADRLPELQVFSPPDDGPRLPYLDRTVDVVVLAAGDDARLAEARRVASEAVVALSAPDEAGVEWLRRPAPRWGGEVSLLVFPDARPQWSASLRAIAETLGAGFAGEIRPVGEGSVLASAGEALGDAGARLEPIEAPGGASLADRARAGSQGTGAIQVLVTDPALPLPGWLPSLLALLAPGRGAGVAGARVLSPAGSLQEAGGVIAADGSRQRWGAGDSNPDRPRYRFVRRVDFCSPPLLAARSELFERLEGLGTGDPDEAVIDFSLRASRAGAQVLYQPQARVVRIGGAGL